VIAENFEPVQKKCQIFWLFFKFNFLIGMSVQSSSHQKAYLIASVLILQEPKNAENRKLSWENDEAQTQKLNQGRIIKKIGFFSSKFQPEQKCFLGFVKKQIKGIIFCQETLIFG
jgi:hypothetical protein